MLPSFVFHLNTINIPPGSGHHPVKGCTHLNYQDFDNCVLSPSFRNCGHLRTTRLWRLSRFRSHREVHIPWNTHRAELSCARNLAPSKPQDLQSIFRSMSRSRACPVFKKMVSLGAPWEEGNIRTFPAFTISAESLTHLMIWELPTRMWCASHWHRGSENLGLLPLGQLWNQGSLPAAHLPVAPQGQRNSKDVTIEEQRIMCGWR